jgi:hypothetical protein
MGIPLNERELQGLTALPAGTAHMLSLQTTRRQIKAPVNRPEELKHADHANASNGGLPAVLRHKERQLRILLIYQ